MPEPVRHKPQTSKQVKRAYQRRKKPAISDAELRRIERKEELERRAEKLKEKERQKRANKKKREEKEQKVRDIKLRLGTESEEKIPASQNRITRFLWKADTPTKSEGLDETVHQDSEDAEDECTEGTTRRRPLMEKSGNTMSHGTDLRDDSITSKEVQLELHYHPSCPSSPVNLVTVKVEQPSPQERTTYLSEEEEAWASLLPSNTQIERELSFSSPPSPQLPLAKPLTSIPPGPYSPGSHSAFQLPQTTIHPVQKTPRNQQTPRSHNPSQPPAPNLNVADPSSSDPFAVNSDDLQDLLEAESKAHGNLQGITFELPPSRQPNLSTPRVGNGAASYELPPLSQRPPRSASGVFSLSRSTQRTPRQRVELAPPPPLPAQRPSSTVKGSPVVGNKPPAWNTPTVQIMPEIKREPVAQIKPPMPSSTQGFDLECGDSWLSTQDFKDFVG
ncbi:MAG: hypothetical protein MMC33_006913 [Icmadophila ericetorum]|nr:hypothetical protein [Icmadophila ericetorum]